MTVQTHVEDQYVATWLEHVLPGLVEIYDVIRKETGDEDFAADFLCWVISSGGVSAIESEEEREALATKMGQLRSSMVPSICSIYKATISSKISARKARRVAMAFADSRWRFGGPEEE